MGATERQKIDLDFITCKLPYNQVVTVDKTLKDTILKGFNYYYTSTPFSFQFGAFKIDDVTFRLNVTMSKQENSKFVPQKIANIKVQINK